MAITNTTLASATFNGNGATTAFATGFQFLTNADLQVVVTSSAGVETIKTLTTDYTVTGAGDSGGGTVTFLVAPATGTKVNIKSNITLDQQTDYTEGGSFAANTHEAALDKLTKISQQIKEITNRSLKLPISNQDVATELSNPVANYVLRVNAAADAIEWASGASIGLTGAVTVPDADFTLTDDSDTTKQAQFQLSGISTATTRTLTLQDLNGTIYTTGGVDVSLADGGTGASLADPNADRIMFWDDSAGAVTWLTAGSGLSITGTTITATGGGGGLADVVDDTTPQLGGNLDVNGQSIVSVSNGNIPITPNGTGSVVLDGLNWPQADGTADYLLKTDGAGQLSWTAPPSSGGSWVLISSGTASSSASLSFTGLSSTYSAYAAVLTNILPATDNVELYMRTSTNNGSSYDSGASNYVWKGEANYGSGAGTYASYGGAATYIGLTSTSASYQASNSAGEGWCGTVNIYQPSAVNKCKVRYSGAYIATTGVFTFIDGAGYRDTAADVDAIQFLFSSGNIASGTIYLYGLKAS